ncbi:MAG: AbrB/MazE/SpoVT family DNA-binding domain-containing protein [Nitriliruptorales bacterium]|nr:AbrB/MazE/SpoVT family DNA-binding domain-containing protein [Nitriliruptorales bacterium]
MSDTAMVEVGPKGRVVIPAALRRQLGIEEGTRLIALIENGAVVLVPREGVEQRLQAMFRDVGASMADELIQERRAEAAGEASA